MSIYLITCWNKECGKEFEYNTDNKKEAFAWRKITPDIINPKLIIAECPFCGTMNSFVID